MKVVVEDSKHVILDAPFEGRTRTIVAYIAKPEAFDREAWFVGGLLPENLRRATNNAIVSLDGVPSAGALARKINELLEG